MYKGAGFRSAIAITEGHTAALVHLPDYDNATVFLELDGEGGWVWAEATGRNNPLGWMPKDLVGEPMVAYEVTDEVIAAIEPTEEPSAVVAPGAGGGGGGFSIPFPFFGVIFFLWIISSMFRRRRRAG